MGEGEVRRPDIDEAFRNGTPIDRASGRAVEGALRMHKRLGHSIAVGRDGKVIWIPPENIPVRE